MIRDIVTWGDPRLLAANDEVVAFDAELRALVRDLVTTCHAAPGLGLAAPQIGVNRSVAIVDTSVGKDPADVIVLVNPRVLTREGMIKSSEGCLSVPGFSASIGRPERVEVEAADERGTVRRVSGDGLLARALCHEIDHLNATLYFDHLRGLGREMLLRKLRKLHPPQNAKST